MCMKNSIKIISYHITYSKEKDKMRASTRLIINYLKDENLENENEGTKRRYFSRKVLYFS